MPREKQFDENEAVKKLTQIFWKKGYNACSVGDLVAASGLSRSSLYDTFGDKEKLFVRCLENYRVEIKKVLEAATIDKVTPSEKIKAALLMPFTAQTGSNCKGCMALNTINELQGNSQEIKEIVTNTKKGWEDFLTVSIKAGQAAGELTNSDSPEKLAGLLYTMMCGILVLQPLATDQSLVDQVDLIMKLIQPKK